MVGWWRCAGGRPTLCAQVGRAVASRACGALWLGWAPCGLGWRGGLSSNLKERDELDWTQPVALEGPESFWARVCGVFPGP
jgi:hypothetical protein